MAGQARQMRTLHAVVWITVSIGVTLMGTGLLGSLIGIRAEREGIGAGVMGVAMAMYYIGFVSGMPIMNRVLELLSRRRMFAGCTVGMGAAAFGYGLVVNPVAWLGLRYATGFLLAGCYLVVETWLNDLARNDVRGKVMGLYVAVVAAGLVCGQVVLAFTEPSSWISFAIAGGITAVAFAPLVLVTKGAGVRHSRVGGMSLREVATAVPSGVVGFVLVGVTQGCVLTMSSVYAARAGLSAGQVGIFVGSITAGAVVFQIPVGVLADRISRRLVMAVLCAVTIAICGGLLIAVPGSAPADVLAFTLGGCSTPLYALGNSYTHDWLPAGQVVAASTALLITYSMGAVFGPLLAAAAMTTLGVEGFYWALIVSHGLLGVFMIYRMTVSPDTAAARALTTAGID